MGEQDAVNISFSFDMRSVEASLDEAARRAEAEAGPDAEQIEELIAELRALLHSGEPIEPGRLARFGNHIKEHTTIAGRLDVTERPEAS